MSPSDLPEQGGPAESALAETSSKRTRIIELNDQLRSAFKGGRVQVNPSVYELDARLVGRALCVMSRRNEFAADGEHDWGAFIFAGFAFEWRIDYCRPDGTGESPDPADPQKTFRVLTLSAVEDLLIRPTQLSA